MGWGDVRYCFPMAILVVIVFVHGNGSHFELFNPPQQLPHTTVDIPTKFDEA
jgi:hypothetical protein